MKRLAAILSTVIAALAVLVVGWLGQAQPAAAVPTPAASLSTYSYDAHLTPASPASCVSERGPPVAARGYSIYGPVDVWLPGFSACPGPRVSSTIYTYNEPTPNVEFAAGRAMTQEHGRRADADHSPLSWSGVAANAKPWLRGTHGNAGHVPDSVRSALSGRSFSSWEDFRGEFWKAASADPALAGQFSASNQRLMSQGLAPFVHSGQTYGGRMRYELHHVIPRSRGGGVYDLNNIVVVTPRYHAEILSPSYHYGGGR